MNRSAWLRRARRAMVAGAAITGATALGVGAWTLLPRPADLIAPGSAPGVRIEDRHGVLLRSTRGADGSRTEWVPYAEIDPDVILAFIAVEDRRFWDHRGIDPRAVARAARDNLRADRIVSGASTISMQLARLLHPRARGWSAKLAETRWAVRLERHLTKQQILEQYLNR